jgi:peptidoglycan/xylan/chitin deacetylase (PgdA/CDA1 family)
VGPNIALTFDDGPSPWTSGILDLLAEHCAHATFFVLGANVAGLEEVLERAIAQGHELGLHTWSHPHLPELADSEILEELARTRAEIERACGVECRVWRPPYFEVDDRVRGALRSMGLVEAGCTIAPEDYHWPAERTASYVIERLEPGAIVDLHDGRPDESSSDQTRTETIKALATILEEMDRQGYEGVPFSGLSARRA